MTGIENHHKRNAPTSISNDLGLVDAVLQIIVALVGVIGGYGNGCKKRMNNCSSFFVLF